MSAHVRRGLRCAAAGAVVAAGAVSLSSPASAAPAKVDRVPYTCTATNSTIDLSLDGSQQFYVTAETDLPTTVQSGETVPATDTTLTLDLSVKLVNRLMGPMKVTDVKGGSSTKVDLTAVAPGGDVIKAIHETVTGPNGESGPLVKDWVKLVKDQEVSIVAQGKVGAIPVPEAPAANGLIYVQTPKSFTLHSEMSPPVIGSIAKADLECKHGTLSGTTFTAGAGAERVIGTIPIGAGCSQTDCPVPADTNTDGPGTDPGTGSGDGTDPEVIDPVNPDDPTDVSDSGYTWEDTDGDGVADTQTTSTSAETTELPATGSPVAAGLAALLAALVAVRLALAIRTRRTGA